MSRKKLIAGNWKMYKTPAQAVEFMTAFLPMVWEHERDEVAICPSFLSISAVVKAAQDSKVGVGGQDIHWEKEGAFTGEVSAGMLVASGCSYVILGHSERRQFFGETDDTVNTKLKAAFDANLIPIVCVGEVLEEREAGLTGDVLRRQCNGALRGVSGERASRLVIAYEPVWAIGTGQTATPKLASDAHRVIRSEVARALGRKQAEAMRILYGGSVKPDNAKALMSEEEIDGALVGGASLDPESFERIVKW